MKILTTLIILLLTSQAIAASDDRAQINEVMSCFFKWDLHGGTNEEAEKCFHPKAQYHRLTDGDWVVNTPDLDFEGKGADAHRFNIFDINIYNDLALVSALIRYNPGKNENPFVKTFVLYKTQKGWLITNIIWGKPTPEK